MDGLKELINIIATRYRCFLGTFLSFQWAINSSESSWSEFRKQEQDLNWSRSENYIRRCWLDRWNNTINRILWQRKIFLKLIWKRCDTWNISNFFVNLVSDLSLSVLCDDLARAIERIDLMPSLDSLIILESTHSIPYWTGMIFLLLDRMASFCTYTGIE